MAIRKFDVIVKSFLYERGQTAICHCEPYKIETGLSVECGA